MENLWPVFAKKEEDTPRSIFAKQVEYFNELKLGLRASVSVGLEPSSWESDDPDSITHVFRIQATGLDGFTFNLFKANHKIMSIYPVVVTSYLDNKRYEVANADVLKKVLQRIFNAKETVDAIQNIVSQIQ